MWSDKPQNIFGHSEFILSSLGHIATFGTSLVDHTGFNGGLVGLSKVCWFERSCFFGTPSSIENVILLVCDIYAFPVINPGVEPAK